ncbi:MAG: coiled-coil domain-containing protein [Sarcina sp.]
MKYVRSIEQFGILKGKHIQYKYFDTPEARNNFNENSEFRGCGGENLYLYDEGEHEYVEGLKEIILSLKRENKKIYEIQSENKEYINKINELKNKIKELQNKENNFNIEEYENIKVKNNELHDKLTQATRNINNLKENITVEKAKNDNLMRIMKERANAKRGLKPKKEHDGYIPLFNKETIFSFKYKEMNKIKSINYNVWRLKLETPYSSKMDLKYILKDIEKYLLHSYQDLKFNCISRFDFKSLIKKENRKDIKRFKEMMENAEEVHVFKIEYEVNFKKGLWEIELLSNREIKISNDLK